MRLRTFTADNMQHAMQMVRDSLGEEAVIISTKNMAEPTGVQVTAAFDDHQMEEDSTEDKLWFKSLQKHHNDDVDEDDDDEDEDDAPQSLHIISPPEDAKPAATSPIKASAASSPSQEAAELLHQADIPAAMIEALIRLLRHHGVNDYVLDYLIGKMADLTEQDAAMYHHYQQPLERWLAALIAISFDIAPLELRHDSCRHILIGTPGAGKTLTTAKIAAYCVKLGKPIHIISTDNKRAGGVEQLSAITDILGIELMVAESRQSLKSLLSDIPLAETVIVDSAGANPYDFYELKDLAEYASLIELDPVLVYPAGSDPYEADEVARAFSFIGVEKMIVTRTDTARRFGSLLNAAHGAGLKFSHITGSEKILGTFDPCTPEYLTKLCMDYRPQED